MQVNGESVYGTQGSPIGKPQWGRCTMQGSKLYLHVFEWPASGKLIVPGLRSEAGKVWLLADSSRKELVRHRLNAEDVEIEVPAEALDLHATVIVVEVKGVVEGNPVKRLFNRDYVNVLNAFDGDIHGSELRLDTGKAGRDVVTHWVNAADSISWTFRAAEAGDYEVKLVYGAKEGSAGGAYVLESAGQRFGGRVVPKGDGYSFVCDTLGTVKLSTPGEYTLTVRAETITGEFLMNLKEVQLHPAG